MLKNKFGFLLTGSFLVITSGLVSLFPQSAWANTSRVPDNLCRGVRGDEYFKLWNNATEALGVCFANPGTITIRVYDVYRVTNGNNYASFEWTTGRTKYRTTFCEKYAPEFPHYDSPINLVTFVGLGAGRPSQCGSTTKPWITESR